VACVTALCLARPATALADPLPAGPAAALWNSEPVTPSSAAGARAPVQATAKSNMDAGDPLSAAMELDGAAQRHGDPVLFLDTADAYIAAAEKDADVAPLDMAVERVRVALDILYFLRDRGEDPNWQPVYPTEVPSLMTRGNETLQKATALRDKLAAGGGAAPPPDDARKSPKSGKGLVIGGAVLIGLGVAGLAVGVTGLGLGAQAQGDATDPTIYGNAYDDVDSRGRMANGLAYAGLIGGAVLAGAGTALLVIGLKRKRSSSTAHLRATPTLGGLLVQGRF
jgi:hypothetical protein